VLLQLLAQLVFNDEMAKLIKRIEKGFIGFAPVANQIRKSGIRLTQSLNKLDSFILPVNIININEMVQLAK
jgi:hypothetical protein